MPLCPTAVAIATGGGSTGGGGGATRAVLHIVHDGRPSGLVKVHAPHTHVATGATGPGAGGPAVASAGGRAAPHTEHCLALPAFSQVHARQCHGSPVVSPGRAVWQVPHCVAAPGFLHVHAGQSHSSTSTASAGRSELHTGHLSTYDGHAVVHTQIQSAVLAPGTGRGMLHTAHFTLQVGLLTLHRHSQNGATVPHVAQARFVALLDTVHAAHSHVRWAASASRVSGLPSAHVTQDWDEPSLRTRQRQQSHR